MKQHEPLTPYEVWCPKCRVTFAIGTRQCIHCGGRLGKRGSARSFGRSRMQTAETPEIPEMPEMAVEELPDETPRVRFSPMTLLWIILIAGTFAQRACQGG